MARTRGDSICPHPPPIEPTGPSERIPPTTLERKRRVATASGEVQEHPDVVPKPDFDATNDALRPGFIGDPEDPSILTAFANHVITCLWLQEDIGELKVATGGQKLKRCGSPYQQIEGRVLTYGLVSLLTSSYSKVDKGILFAFFERWNSETSNFHLPVGEMTITLDDVSSLLHLPIRGAFWNHPRLDKDQAVVDLVSLLGEPSSSVMPEVFQRCKPPLVWLEWLREVYKAPCEDRLWDEAARAFLLHLVGCTIFVDTSATTIDVSYLDLFRNLSSWGSYAWGALALAYLYSHLYYGSQYQT